MLSKDEWFLKDSSHVLINTYKLDNYVGNVYATKYLDVKLRSFLGKVTAVFEELEQSQEIVKTTSYLLFANIYLYNIEGKE